MEKRSFGNTGYLVSVLGFGAGHIGKDNQDDATVRNLLNEILDLGINFIDTAHAYGQSEERIGKFLSARRKEFIISSKGGYDSKWHSDWTYDSVTKSIEESLKRLQTDFIEIYHLHSCPIEVLEKGDVILALEKAREAGKIGIVAYSGENEALAFALESKRFKSIQCSINICDQRGIGTYIKRASDEGLGVIGKRPIANAPWRFESAPIGHYSAEYWYRFREMNINNFGLDWDELSLRYSAFAPGVSTIITGTSSNDHLIRNIKALEKGNLPGEVINQIEEQFKKNDKNWVGLI